MKKLSSALNIAFVCNFFAPHISYADESTPIRITISVIAAGKEVSKVMLPIGTRGDIDLKGNHRDFDNEHSTYHVTGNAQIAVKTKNMGPITFIGDDIVVTIEHLDAEKEKAIADLDAMGVSDQSIRMRALSGHLSSADAARQESIDRENMVRLAEIIKRYGWPGVRFAGASGSQNAFLVLQHADSESQHKYLPLLRDAVDKNDALGDELALLEDRVRVNDGLPQLYGSQAKPNGSSMELYPIEDELNVDKRRAAIGLQPLADYAKMLGITYKSKSSNPVDR
jgi:hypothetical protein